MTTITNKKSIKNIALFMGTDVSSHLLMNELVPQLANEAHKIYIYLPQHRPSKNRLVPELLTLSFFERTLITDYVYPFIDSRPIMANAPCHSPRQLSQIYDACVRSVEDVNDPAFIKELKAESIGLGISIRCYQKFGPDIIRFFNCDGFEYLWNLHPGILPRYQGVMTLFRAMIEGQKHTSYSLHLVDEKWDNGPVIDVRPQPMDSSQAMLTNYCLLASSGAPIIMDNINNLRQGKEIVLLSQNDAVKRYYSFPTREDVDMFFSKGLRLVDPEYIRKIFLEKFSEQGTEHRQALAKVIELALHQHMSLV